MHLDTVGEGRDSAVSVTRIFLPQGLIGLGDLRHFAVFSEPESKPFKILRSLDSSEIEFLAIEPGDLIGDYQPELADEDAQLLDLRREETPFVLNITTIKSRTPNWVTANLVAPIVVSRNSGVGKQVVLMNRHRYSTNFPLIDERP